MDGTIQVNTDNFDNQEEILDESKKRVYNSPLRNQWKAGRPTLDKRRLNKGRPKLKKGEVGTERTDLQKYDIERDPPKILPESRIDVLELIVNYAYPLDWSKWLTITNACKKIGVNMELVYSWFSNQPQLRVSFDKAIALRRDLRQLKAAQNIYDVIDGNSKLKPREVVEVSKWFLEKTDMNYNPKQVIESKSLNINTDMSLEEMELRLASLLNNEE